MMDARKRVHTLLTDAAVAGLSEAEAVELTALLDGQAIDPSYEHAAAAIELGLLDHTEVMPVELEAAVVEQASRYWGFTELRPREPTLGGRGGEILLGAEAEATPIVRHWERSDELVLESSLTNGRIDPLGRVGPGESMRGEILPAAEELPDDDDDDDDDNVAEAERSARFDSEVDAQLDALEQPRARSVEVDDFGDFGDFDDDDDDDEPASAELGKPRKGSRKGHAQPEASNASGVGPEVVEVPRDHRVARWAAYVSAIAALVVLGIALYLFAHRNDPPDPEAIRAAVQKAPDKLEWRLEARQDEPVAQGAAGSILWSSELQTGVLILRGLQANDPATIQYQLWITDGDRDGPAVDGGVFNIPEGEDEVLISVEAKLVIGQPKSFVITVERPGGVVVSSQERVALVATPG